jgi:RNA polymerase sporulation-specific sigma factor
MYKKASINHNRLKGDFFMARYKVEICGVNTANIKVLSNEEMMELFKKYNSGDLSAKEQLINGNLKLVLSILRKYNNRTDNMDDLFQIGCVGLIKAIDNFDLSHGVKFSTYAVPMIIGEVKRYLRDNNSVRIARSIKDIAYKALQAKEELTNSINGEPTIKMIADKLKLTEFEVSNALDSMKDTVSMFEPIYNDGGDTIYLSDQLEDSKNEMKNIDQKIAIKKAIDNLKEKEKYIITQRYFVGKTQMELASEIGISQAQISRLEKSGLNNIKNNIT